MNEESVVYCHLKGGFGNQLFQFSSAVAYALNTEKAICFRWSHPVGATHRDPSIHFLGLNLSQVYEIELRNGSIIFRAIERSQKKRFRREGFRIVEAGELIIEEPSFHFDHIPNIPGDISLNGWYQSFKYLAPHTDVIRKFLRERMILHSKLNTEYICPSECIALHMRFGDYLTPPYSMVHENLGIDYFRRAYTLLNSSIDILKIHLMTDDVKASADKLKNAAIQAEVALIDSGDLPRDLLLFSHHESIIISNSTLSWWGAFLAPSNATVIAPRKWFTEKAARDKNICDLFPNDWILL
jgi:Glycosyl transferase family 11